MKLSALKPRFSIRTMLVLMTLLAMFLAYHLNWIRQRQQLIDSGLATPTIRGMLTTDVRQAPGLLPLFGAQGYFRVQVDLGHDDPEMARVRGLFPEAKCVGYMFVRNKLQARTSRAEEPLKMTPSPTGGMLSR